MNQREIAERASLLAGDIIFRGFNQPHRIIVKQDNTLVSEIDEQAEEAIRSLIEDAFPEHRFLGEEQGESGTNSQYLWVVDSLDGTHNFLAHIPFCSTSIALLENGQVILGVINDPLRGEMFSAARNRGCFLNGQKISVSELSQLSDATIGFTRGSDRSHKEKLGKIYSILGQEVRNTRILGSAALHFAYVACGRFDALVNVGNNLWDVAAGVLLVEEAGGKVTWNKENNQIIACNNAVIHDRISEIIRGEE